MGGGYRLGQEEGHDLLLDLLPRGERESPSLDPIDPLLPCAWIVLAEEDHDGEARSTDRLGVVSGGDPLLSSTGEDGLDSA